MARGHRSHRWAWRGERPARDGSGGGREDRRRRSRRATDTAYGRPFFHRWPYQKWHGRLSTFGYAWPYGARRTYGEGEEREARDERRRAEFADYAGWIRGGRRGARGSRGRDVARYDEGYAPSGRPHVARGRGPGERRRRARGHRGERGFGGHGSFDVYGRDRRR